ncbi:DUF3618 domain-containing protein [Streptomyces sp. VRA16 Mangrove soil]|uniref:DUF3618 domain-containing protein n=1 Tax=Streptomyces sp. VRA16 Mangrove soil TaxID=2817434 RepID=UPI001A9CE7A0|nr:DUF3618 domain-containing protein [Streptomyces sp. VRA16 Mangrove soil]MBO1334518.1 DUF3618 domain-containing protein [Streptomyces sp. VRA16 Mangrove soil]
MTPPAHDRPTAAAPEELRAQIERTRADLGDTVEALAAKADVKGRAKDKAAQVKDQVREQAAAGAEAAREHRVVLVATAVCTVSAGALALWLTLRHRKR